MPRSARWPEVTTDIAVGQMRQIEFIADQDGDWAVHCHKSHHTMNAMGHTVPTMLGVDQRDLARQITQLVPDYMVMADRGMADMAAMRMPLPENTVPMMSGEGPHGPIAMGGMFSVLKVRRDQPAGDYRDPGWYAQPAGSAAYEFRGEVPTPARPQPEKGASAPRRCRCRWTPGARLLSRFRCASRRVTPGLGTRVACAQPAAAAPRPAPRG